jgi:hypothetical protein
MITEAQFEAAMTAYNDPENFGRAMRAALEAANLAAVKQDREALIEAVRAHRFKPDARPLGGRNNTAASLIAPRNARDEIIKLIRDRDATP